MIPMIYALDQVLEQGEIFLLSLDNEIYKIHPENHSASIGAHYRHSLDHFEQLFEGLKSGLIDYDVRRRDQKIETERDAALKKTRELRKAALDLKTQNLPHSIQIRCAVSQDEAISADVDSTMEREIMFCISHAVHHYAIIGMICRTLNIRFSEEFGIAPSTLKYRQAIAIVGALG